MDNETMTANVNAAADDTTTRHSATLRIELQHDQIKALMLIAPKNDVRHYLNGIAFDTTGKVPVAVVTDGHRLLALKIGAVDDDLPHGVYIVPRDAFASIRPLKIGRTAMHVIVTLTASGGVGMLPPTFTVAGATTAAGVCIDGRFPDWRCVVPLTVSGEPGVYNPQYMADFGTVAGLLDGSGQPHVLFAGNGANCAALVNLPFDAVGVLMPVRSDPPCLTRPDWID